MQIKELEEIKNDLQVINEIINDNTEEYLKFEDELCQIKDKLETAFNSIDSLNAEISLLKDERKQELKCGRKCDCKKVGQNCIDTKKPHSRWYIYVYHAFLLVFYISLLILIGKLIL